MPNKQSAICDHQYSTNNLCGLLAHCSASAPHLRTELTNHWHLGKDNLVRRYKKVANFASRESSLGWDGEKKTEQNKQFDRQEGVAFTADAAGN